MLFPLSIWSDIDGLGSSAIGGQLIRKANTQSPFSCDKSGSDTLMAGTDTPRYCLPQVLTPPAILSESLHQEGFCYILLRYLSILYCVFLGGILLYSDKLETVGETD